jgi:predicted TIM-barrel fold metal-dependent hydrolase
VSKRDFRVLDGDMHTMEPLDLWDRYLEEPFKKFLPEISGHTRARPDRPGAARAEPRPRRHPHYAAAAERGFDPGSSLKAMDIEGVDVGVVFGTRGRHVQMRDDLDPAFAAALARAHNNWTHEYCAERPSRLKFAAQISFHDPDLAVEEARRAVKRLGAVAIIGNPNPVNGRHIHDPYFEPLWTEIEELDVPVAFHPTGVWSLRDNIARRFLGRPNGETIAIAAHNPVESMLGFASLAGGGVLERHPKLRCVFLEGTCGWLPWWLWRMDDTWEKFGWEGDIELSARPSDYFFRQCFVATEPDERMLPQAVAAIGSDNIVFATDYPHRDGLFPEAVDKLAGMGGLSDQAKKKIFWDNAARLYRADAWDERVPAKL